MNNVEDSKFKNFRDSQKETVLPKPINYSAPSSKQDMKHIRIMSGFRPNSEMPGNDR